MPLPRFRIRTLMIAVAVVALTMAAALWVRRENERRALARQKELLDAIGMAYSATRQQAVFELVQAIRSQPGEQLPDDFGPWFPVPPDPPEPTP